MAYNAPPLPSFLKNRLGTDASILRAELRKLEEETALLQTEITAGINGWAETQYIGSPYLDQSWKMTIVDHLAYKELQFFRKEGAGEINENWVQWMSLPREYAEAYRYNNSTPRNLSVQGTWYPSIGLTKGAFYVLEYIEPGNGDNYMLVPQNHAGIYRTNWVTSLSGPTGRTIEMAFQVNGVVQQNSVSRIKLGSQDTVNFSGTNLMFLDNLSQCKLVTRCVDAPNIDIVYVHSNINTTRVG